MRGRVAKACRLVESRLFEGMSPTFASLGHDSADSLCRRSTLGRGKDQTGRCPGRRFPTTDRCLGTRRALHHTWCANKSIAPGRQHDQRACHGARSGPRRLSVNTRDTHNWVHVALDVCIQSYQPRAQFKDLGLQRTWHCLCMARGDLPLGTVFPVCGGHPGCSWEQNHQGV